jgi:histone H3/H4
MNSLPDAFINLLRLLDGANTIITDFTATVVHNTDGSGTAKTGLRGARVYEEIEDQQHSTGFSFPKRSFQRLVMETGQYFRTGLFYTTKALKGLQASAESYLVELFEGAHTTAALNHRTKINLKDIQSDHRVLTFRKETSNGW